MRHFRDERPVAAVEDLVALADDVLDRIDAIVPPGESIGAMDMVYRGPEIGDPARRRRPGGQRSAA